MSRVTLLVAVLFGLLSPYRAAPRAAESEEVEVWGDAAEGEEAAHGRTHARHGRRAQRHGGPTQADIELVAASIGPSTGIGTLARARWQLPRRALPPDEDPLG
jgi:hypothetical protein